MSQAVKVVSKKEEYGKRQAFHGKFSKFHMLLDNLLCYTNGEDNADRFECVKDDFKRAITILKRYKEKGIDADLSDLGHCEGDLCEVPVSEAIDLEDIDADINALGGDIDSIIDDMETYLKECDTDWDWMVFVAW